MIKEEKPIFLKVFLVVILILFINIGVFSYKLATNNSLTGLTIADRISTAYISLSLFSRMLLIVQWTVLAVLLIGGFVKDKKLGKKEKKDELEGINLNEMSRGNGTDIDTLYAVLKKKKKLSVEGIMRLFKVKKDVAIEWCKVLEKGQLGFIDYDSKNPVIRINEKDKEAL